MLLTDSEIIWAPKTEYLLDQGTLGRYNLRDKILNCSLTCEGTCIASTCLITGVVEALWWWVNPTNILLVEGL